MNSVYHPSKSSAQLPRWRRLRIGSVSLIASILLIVGIWIRSYRFVDQLEFGSFRIILFAGVARSWHVPDSSGLRGWYSARFETAESRMLADWFRADTAWPIGFRTGVPSTVGGVAATGFYVKCWLPVAVLTAILAVSGASQLRKHTHRGFEVSAAKHSTRP